MNITPILVPSNRKAASSFELETAIYNQFDFYPWEHPLPNVSPVMALGLDGLALLVIVLWVGGGSIPTGN